MSDILIKGMEMPWCEHQEIDIRRGTDGKWYAIDGDWYEIISVPDHGRLIDKDALEQDISDSVVFSGRENNPEIYGANKIINRIHLAPTIIPASEEHTMEEFMYGQEGNPNDGSM